MHHGPAGGRRSRDCELVEVPLPALRTSCSRQLTTCSVRTQFGSRAGHRHICVARSPTSGTPVSRIEALDFGGGPFSLPASCGSHHPKCKRDRRGRLKRRRPQRAQPARGKPLLRDRELAPAAVQAHHNVWRWRNGRMAHRAGPISIEPNFGRDCCKNFRVTFWTAHDYTSDGGVNNAIRRLPEPYPENCPESTPCVAIVVPKVLWEVLCVSHITPKHRETSIPAR